MNFTLKQTVSISLSILLLISCVVRKSPPQEEKVLYAEVEKEYLSKASALAIINNYNEISQIIDNIRENNLVTQTNGITSHQRIKYFFLTNDNAKRISSNTSNLFDFYIAFRQAYEITRMYKNRLSLEEIYRSKTADSILVSNVRVVESVYPLAEKTVMSYRDYRIESDKGESNGYK